MVGSDGFRQRLRLLRRSERGMALPVALFAMLAATALASAAVISSVDVQQGSHRDSASKQAIAAADAGAGVALERLNRYASVLNNAANSNCLGVSAEGTLVVTGAVNGWCPAIGGTVGGSTYSYRASAFVAGAAMSIVSTGTANGVSRRIDMDFTAESIDDVLKEEGLIGKDNIKIPGNPHIRVNIGTNGDIETSGNSWEVCGNARHGPGKEGPTEEELSCEGEEVERNVELPPVSNFMPTDIETNNDNGRLTKCVQTVPEKVPALCEEDGYSGTRTATSPFNPAARSLTLSGHNTLTLGGRDYWLCQLTLSGSSHLIMASGAHARLFFDTPENCNLPGPQVSVGGNSSIEATAFEPELGIFDMPGIYLLGGSGSTVSLAGNSGANQMVLYGPDTEITMKGNATYNGVIAGRSLEIGGNPTFEQAAGFEPQPIGGLTIYSRQFYVECSGSATSVPNENC
jgi:Tfp pilus assembly protein PilX